MNSTDIFFDISVKNTTSNSTLPTYSGFIFLIASSVFYGSNYLPVKKFETGDGMFFQLVLCIGIWFVGFVVNCARNFPRFYALPLLGGFFWSTGNNCVVPIIKTIGMGLGMIFWNCVGLITGWATSRFDLFGLNQKKPNNDTLNYIGVALTLFSTVFYLFINNSKKNTQEISEEDKKINEMPTTSGSSNETLLEKNDIYQKLSSNKKRIVGISLSVFSGLMYGEAFTPILYVQDNYDEASKNNLDYLFSFYTGIVMTSLAYFVAYCIIKRNKPVINNQIVLPGLCSGILWGIANVCYFFSNNILPQAICYPISNAGPPIVASIWGVLVFREIRGRKSLIFLAFGFLFAITGAVLVGFSF